MKIKAGIVGATGYAGAELVRLLTAPGTFCRFPCGNPSLYDLIKRLVMVVCNKYQSVV